MTLGINTNLAALDTQRQQARSQSDLGTAIARLSSGLRINSAKDDAAGLAIADRFTSQIRGTTQAGRNANDGISLAQTAEGALASIDDNLQRIRELSVQSANATNSASDRASLQLEVSQLQSEIDRVATQTQFNGINLLDGSFTSKQFQVGSNVGQLIAMPSLASARSSNLGVYAGFTSLDVPEGSFPDNLPYARFVSIAGGPNVFLGNAAHDVKAIADVTNAANIPGLTLVAGPTIVASAASTATASVAGTAVFNVNGVAIGLVGNTGAAALGANRATAVTAINAQSAATGVVALDTGSGIRLTASDGRNILLSYSAGTFTGSSAADFGLVSTPINRGTLSTYYVAPPGVTGGVTFIDGAGYSSTATIGSTGTAVSALDISSASGANSALRSLDAALAAVAAARASLGAVQNRFASTTVNLQTVGDNLSASRSRIEDADFGLETANLSRAQVLQQASTAMLAQANQSTSQVLALLRSGSSP